MRLKNKNLNSIFFILPVIMLAFSIVAQDGTNLVDNPSFENAQNKKLRKIGDINRSEGWTSATAASADLFSGDTKVSDIMTPDNIYGTEEPKDGINYAGVIACSYRENENRTYLQTQLSTSLKKGMRYKVQFYASLAELSKYSSNRLGAYLSKKPIGSDKKIPAIIMEETHVEHPKQALFNATYGWDLVCGEYIASGGEKYLTIGNFSNEIDIKTDRVSKPRNLKGKQIVAAYYYIDDVSVELLGPNEKCNCNYGDVARTETSTVYQRSPEILKNMTVKEKLEQFNIFYAEGRYDVRMDGEQTLDRIVEMMKEDPNLKIQITGHSDDEEANSPENKIISARRSDYVKDLIIEKGISEKRVFSDDAKNNRPSKYVSDNDEDKLKAAKNRRVSFKAI